LCGDVNADGAIDSLDFAGLISFYFHGGPRPCPSDAGDVNCDGVIDLLDLVYFGYFASGAIPELCCQNTPRDPARWQLYYEHERGN
ncbi:MAG TPA: dockerin type I domain-containing protein, partial [candidate division Zixibacteria bacterium]|nr:dockerin type I domain-containing protein [candidate division Zixibacteria bacterium]